MIQYACIRPTTTVLVCNVHSHCVCCILFSSQCFIVCQQMGTSSTNITKSIHTALIHDKHPRAIFMALISDGNKITNKAGYRYFYLSRYTHVDVTDVFAKKKCLVVVLSSLSFILRSATPSATPSSSASGPCWT